MILAEKVELLRSRGASVYYSENEPEKVSVLIQPHPHNYIYLREIEAILNELNVRATLDSLTRADMLLIQIFKDSNII